jgi:hypothetical protein
MIRFSISVPAIARSAFFLLLAVVFAGWLGGCPSSPPVSPVDASDAAALGLPDMAPIPPSTPACQSACANLQRWCKEGSDPLCPTTLAKEEADRLVVPTDCPAGAGCSMTCAYCAKASTAAEAVARCATSCQPQ